MQQASCISVMSKLIDVSDGCFIQRQLAIFGKRKPFKNDEKYLLFYRKSSFRSQDI